ncbi:hypothetical protein BALOs_0361 [Halobacteriovorax sp. BALOs_7]|uniref:Uncharacterized protein n=1 Tax=Halobacteriovorax vibrionivorans TaxID=2152716 RepID=A0ABY0IGJ1_9BACT|nr:MULTISPECIES: hypothetical protein [Halobacteriovorax]AYF43376.1 hypothetical protein BALOs_0361 [Halobacteriovorax sp. BALOs_7]RZF22049.1 hypothetical protein DAY19_10230 [Halobacteriovorax vibrionivorans]TGD47087.1 hypothetical protein EP118_09305 [Halobacteriovorax sp. Y22]
MKRVLTTTLFLLNLLFAQGASAQTSDILNTVEYALTDSVKSLKIHYSAHNGANVKEFLRGRELVNSVLKGIIDEGFTPIQPTLDIGITPVKMPEGLSVLKDGKLFVSITIDEDTLERVLLDYFRFDTVTEDGILFFLHNSSNTEEFHLGKDLVLAVIAKIKESGFVMDVTNLEVGISPVTMSGEHIIEKDGRLLVSTEVNLDNLERTLLKYFVWPN